MNQLRPFFKYFGSKWRASGLYPEPLLDTIVEPFAGSAGYSLRYPHKEVILNEIDPVVFSIWKYLIGVKESEIEQLPDLGEDQSVDELDVCQEARDLIGFWINVGISTPRKRMCSWAKNSTNLFWGPKVRKRIVGQLPHIRHWRVYNLDYKDLPDFGVATWYIDPPYVGKLGFEYIYGPNQIDYDHLSKWCRSRRGRVIVSEGEGAKWLPFEELGYFNGAKNTVLGGRKVLENIWVRH